MKLEANKKKENNSIYFKYSLFAYILMNILYPPQKKYTLFNVNSYTKLINFINFHIQYISPLSKIISNKS